MATIKLYTDIEQSKKLSNILPIESADMCWTKYIDDGEVTSLHATVNYGIVPIEYPSWSLAKLLDILKDKIIFGGASDKEWFVSYTTKNPTKVSFIYKSNLVDACVAMIEKLHELNLL